MKAAQFSRSVLHITAVFIFTSISALAAAPPGPSAAAIPFTGIGAKATMDYQGDALAVTATGDGARLRCGFQKLEGRATAEGLWLESTANGDGGRLRLVADSVSRDQGSAEAAPFPWAEFDWAIPPAGALVFCEPDIARHCGSNERASVLECGSSLPLSVGIDPSQSGRGLPHSKTLRERESLHCSPGVRAANPHDGEDAVWRTVCGMLARTGTMEVTDKLVRYVRPGLTEEYSVSVDGLRQDFVITERPGGDGELRVELALTGARAEAMAYGAKLKLDGSNRSLAYSRLRATDATGRELPARMEVVAATRQSAAVAEAEDGGGLPTRRYASLAVLVDDADAVYPVRIDPTFSDADWVSLNPETPGANLVVKAIAVDENGSVYVGGEFSLVGTVSANRIAKWDGSSWSTLGSGIAGEVRALAVSGTNLYAAGYIYRAGEIGAKNVVKWDGRVWSALGSWPGRYVSALAVSGTNLYAGGEGWFVNYAGTNLVGKWDGQAWSVLGSGLGGGVYPDSPPNVQTLAVIGTNLYVGGSFSSAGGLPAKAIARWDGTAWSALGAGMNNGVRALAVSGTDLYAGGSFTTAGGVSAKSIAKWDGSTWVALGTGVSNGVWALTVSGTDLYAGGAEYYAGGNQNASITKWDGSTWSALGSGMNGGNPYAYIYALAARGTNLFAGGDFRYASGVAAYRIANWDGSTWSALGAGMDNDVSALAVSGTDLYAGGSFLSAGKARVNYVSRWDGSTWSPLGSGMNNAVYALAVNGAGLFAAGAFTTAGGIAANYIAKWDGDSWSALGPGLGPWVLALATRGSDLYAGGYFTNAGGLLVNYIAKWDGSSWSPLGAGMDGPVYALAVNSSNLYAGGRFTRAGGVSASGIAKWDGSAWSALGSGVGGDSWPFYPNVEALVVVGTDLYAGGWFATAGGVTANRIARWDGTAWSALAAPIPNYFYPVRALAVNGTDLYVGGDSQAVGAHALFKWDGNAWSTLGSGVVSYVSVNALAADELGHLFVGGNFSAAGTNRSPYIAQANIGQSYSIPPGGVIRNIYISVTSVTLDCLGIPTTAYALQRASDVRFTESLTTVLTTNAPAGGQFQCIDPDPPSTTAFYRLLKQ